VKKLLAGVFFATKCGLFAETAKGDGKNLVSPNKSSTFAVANGNETAYWDDSKTVCIHEKYMFNLITKGNQIMRKTKLFILLTFLLSIGLNSWATTYSRLTLVDSNSQTPRNLTSLTFDDETTWAFNATAVGSAAKDAGTTADATFYKWEGGSNNTAVTMTCTISGHGINGTIKKITVYNYLGYTPVADTDDNISITIGGAAYGSALPCKKDNNGVGGVKNATVFTSNKITTSTDNIVITITNRAQSGNKSNVYFAGVDIEYSGPTITTQPASASYVTGYAATALHVEAVASTGGGDLSYQWYRCDDVNRSNSSAIGAYYGGTSASYTPSTAAAGTFYYYCVVTDSNGSTTSNVATIIVSAASAPTISVSGAPGGDVFTGTEVTLTATITGVPTPTIKWFSNTTASTSGDGVSQVATGESYSPSTSTPGTYYYFAQAVNSEGNALSTVQTITVVATEQYSTPAITEKNGTVQITSSDDIKVSQIKYSLDGGESWNTYSIPFNLSAATTVKAKVVQGEDLHYTDSEVASKACNAIPAAIEGSLSITLYHDGDNWTKTASQGGDTKDTWTGKAATDFDGYIIALDNEGQTGSNIKALSTGNAINEKTTIKGSNGRRIKFTIPTGVKVNRITIYSYTNGDNESKYATTWSFVGETANMIGLSLQDNAANNGKSESSASNPDVRVFSFATPLEDYFYLNNSGYQQCFYMVLDYTQTVSKTITAAGWATYCSPYALDFSGDITNLTDAYIVTGGEGGVLAKTSVKGGKVAANTGLLIKGTEGTIAIPVAASGTDHSATNKLVGVTADTPIAAEAGWVLMSSGSHGLGFYKNTNAFTVGANTAYLPASFATNAPSMFRLTDEENGATNIEAIDATEDAVKFIENGKLYIKKNNVVYDALGRVVR